MTTTGINDANPGIPCIDIAFMSNQETSDMDSVQTMDAFFQITCLVKSADPTTGTSDTVQMETVADNIINLLRNSGQPIAIKDYTAVGTPKIGGALLRNTMSRNLSMGPLINGIVLEIDLSVSL